MKVGHGEEHESACPRRHIFRTAHRSQADKGVHPEKTGCRIGSQSEHDSRLRTWRARTVPKNDDIDPFLAALTTGGVFPIFEAFIGTQNRSLSLSVRSEELFNLVEQQGEGDQHERDERGRFNHDSLGRAGSEWNGDLPFLTG